MIKLVFIVVLALSLGGCATSYTPYNDWSEKEQSMYKYHIALQAIDTLQTSRAIKCQKESMCTLEELNPLYSSTPSMGRLIRTKMLTNILLYHMLAKGDTDREGALKFANGLITVVVVNNQIQINKAL